MCTQARQAGPDRGCSTAFRMDVRGSGPAGPQWTVGSLGLSLGVRHSGRTGAPAAGPCRPAEGTAGPPGTGQEYRLAAAAAVDALQHYLRQYAADPPTPTVELLDITVSATGLEEARVNATVAVTYGAKRITLLGSALVRNDRPSTAVAAVLASVNRYVDMMERPAPLGRGQSQSVHVPRTAVWAAHGGP